MELVRHTIEPVFDAHSRVLILGTMPSPKSRALGFYYGHPQNRFWRVLSAVLGDDIPAAPEEKRAYLLARHIAMWDALASCEISGASDSSIRNPQPNELSHILSAAPVRCVFTTGKAASRLYRRYCMAQTGMEDVCLPSPSAANCGMPFDVLVQEYGAVRTVLEQADGSA